MAYIVASYSHQGYGVRQFDSLDNAVSFAKSIYRELRSLQSYDYINIFVYRDDLPEHSWCYQNENGNERRISAHE